MCHRTASDGPDHAVRYAKLRWFLPQTPTASIRSFIQGRMTEQPRPLSAQLEPPPGIAIELFQALLRKGRTQSLVSGTVLFHAGDSDRSAYYLLSGEMRLTDERGTSERLCAGTAAAKRPIAHRQPRTVTAIARGDCRVLRFDREVLEASASRDTPGGIQVTEIRTDPGLARDEGDSDDWMTRWLQSGTFSRMPPAKLQALFLRIQERPVSAGEVIIRQGEEGDCFYVVKLGKAKVTRCLKVGTDLTLAHLSAGNGFGEEALLTGAVRNASVTMLTDGVVMRLSRQDFDELLRDVTVRRLSFSDAKERKGAIWIDVRLEREHQGGAITGSINIPLFMVRLKADALDPKKDYIVYCDTGQRSAAAAFLLTGRGLNVYVLDGGLAAQPSRA
jgi:CRP-like cAMP-binding protein